MGLMKDAEPLFRRALDAKERTLGAEHPSTLISVNQLACCLQAMGLMKDAEPLFRRALEAQERMLGAEHPDTLVSVNSLALCLKAMGRLRDAEPLYRRAVEASERTLGAQQFGIVPQSHGPAERCRTALQESCGGQRAHPRIISVCNWLLALVNESSCKASCHNWLVHININIGLKPILFSALVGQRWRHGESVSGHLQGPDVREDLGVRRGALRSSEAEGSGGWALRSSSRATDIGRWLPVGIFNIAMVVRKGK
eukprot:s4666_g5.t1